MASDRCHARRSVVPDRAQPAEVAGPGGRTENIPEIEVEEAITKEEKAIRAGQETHRVGKELQRRKRVGVQEEYEWGNRSRVLVATN